MKNKIMRAILILLMLSLMTLVACDSDYRHDDSGQVNTDSVSVEQLPHADEEESTLNKSESITQRYLTRDNEINKNTLNIELSLVFDISSEGASFFTIFDDSGNLEYFAVDVFGEMGRISHSYTFTEQFIVYSIIEISYSEPFFINPTDIPISEAHNNSYIIFNGGVYRFVDEGEYLIVNNELRDSIIERLIYFLEIINIE